MQIFLIIFFIIISSSSSTTRRASTLKTDPSDTSALLAFKSSISPKSINPWSCLATWNFTSDPCHPSTPTHFTCGITCSSSRITSITLDSASYSGTISPSISKLTYLSHLSLNDNSFYGTLPLSISSLPNLQSLSLNSNNFSGSIPESLFYIPTLKSLDLARNHFTGSIPSFNPTHESALSELDASFNQLSGSLPNALPPKLVYLALRGNTITGFIKKTTFQSLMNLEVVELAANKIDGRIEGWFFLLPSLQQVNLANNSIRSINVWKPSNGLGERLVAVDLDFNRIEGGLSENFAEYASLVSLSMKSNRLRGQIPWKYNKMKRLYLDGNFLNGEVPDVLLKGELVAGSFGDNCLESCPENLAICSPVQKPDWVCKQVYGAGGRGRPHRPRPSPVHG